ncbi:MAG TPA: AMP-binding protein [Chloroflexota bacterium]|nr:AMP-binding protein [Chloroflexota bacterium]
MIWYEPEDPFEAWGQQLQPTLADARWGMATASSRKQRQHPLEHRADPWREQLTFGQLVDRAAERWGDREALCFEGRRWTFAQLRDETDRVARGLIAAGIEPGEHVCLWLNNSPEYLFTLFAIAKIGAVLVPINTRFRTRDMAYIVTQSDATTLISADRSGPVDYLAMIEDLHLLPDLSRQEPGAISAPHLPALRRVILLSDQAVPGTLAWDALLEAGQQVPAAEVGRRCAATDPDGTAYIMYTSGTTGFPKGVMQSHNALRNVADEASRMGITSGDAILNYLPLYHVFALYVAALMSPMTGARQVLTVTFDPAEALRLIEAERITVIHGFDTHFKDLLEHPSRASRDVSSLRTGILAAGMHSSEPIARRAQELMRTVTGFGMTEVGVGATLSFLDSDPDVRTTMSGWPLPGYEVKVVDPATGVSQPPSELGEICIRGYQVMQGYYKKPEETAKAVDAEGWLHTGDVGFLREDGCLRFLGRYKDMLKVGGENVDPMEIEAFLLEDPRVNHVAVVGLPDLRLAEVPVAFVILEDGTGLSEDDVVSLCRGRLASFKIPRRVFFVDRFPMTGSGKIQKYLLRKEAQRRCVGPDSAAERPRAGQVAWR